MEQKELEYLRQVEDHASRTGWVSPLTREDKEYFAYLRQVSKRYNIDMSKANRLEYNFVIRVAESEFYAYHTSREIQRRKHLCLRLSLNCRLTSDQMKRISK